MFTEIDSQLRGGTTSVECNDDDTRTDNDVVRCGCGALLARYVKGKIELKCRRCKRTLLVPIESLAESPARD